MNSEFVICEDCKGSGFVSAGASGIAQKCPTCWGSGKLTWVERVVGKQRPKFEEISGISGSSGWIGGSSYSFGGSTGFSGVYGNSLTDSGNNSYISTPSKNNIPIESDYYLTDKSESITDKKKPKNSVDKFVIIAKKVLKDLVNDYGIIFKLMF
jgi:hypothetical protein